MRQYNHTSTNISLERKVYGLESFFRIDFTLKVRKLQKPLMELFSIWINTVCIPTIDCDYSCLKQFSLMGEFCVCTNFVIMISFNAMTCYSFSVCHEFINCWYKYYQYINTECSETTLGNSSLIYHGIIKLLIQFGKCGSIIG